MIMLNKLIYGALPSTRLADAERIRTRRRQLELSRGQVKPKPTEWAENFWLKASKGSWPRSSHCH